MFHFTGDKDPVSLGWCTLPLYDYHAEESPTDSSGTTYAPLAVHADKWTVPLSTGVAPEYIPANPHPEYKAGGKRHLFLHIIICNFMFKFNLMSVVSGNTSIM